jgi:hypothetical protein
MSEVERRSYCHSQNTKSTRNEISFEGELILCKLCLWCASIVPGNGSINICPVCRTKNIHAMPITDDYSKYNTTSAQGLIVEL